MVLEASLCDEILKPLRSVARFINTAVNFKIERR